jgi:hypothetical protein
VLAVVEAMHKEACHSRRTNIDNIVTHVIHIVGGMMLEDYSRRPDALRVYDDLTRAVQLATPPGHSVNPKPLGKTAHPRRSMPGRLPPDMPVGLGLDIDSPSMKSPHESQGSSIDRLPDRRATFGARSHSRPFSDASSTGQVEVWRQSPPAAAHDTAHVSQQTPITKTNSPVPQSGAPVGQAALPVASIDDILDYIHKRNLNPKKTSLKGEEWLKRLHGRDQVWEHA